MAADEIDRFVKSLLDEWEEAEGLRLADRLKRVGSDRHARAAVMAQVRQDVRQRREAWDRLARG